MTVLIDLHGVPGSQNGREESGLIGPILFTPIFDGQLLKEFYTAGSNVVGAANSSGINITIHGKID